ncbi:MAG: lipocalin family protein [Bacteroidota bacterium]
MKNLISALLAALALFISGCSLTNYPPLDTVDNVDVQRYLGKWYEIASLPNNFQKGCSCSSAEYSMIDSTTIRVVNKCFKEGKLDDVNGKAFVVEGSGNSKLKVQFFWPFRGDYWIIDLDKNNYSYAVVGTPSRKYMWILSRTPMMEESLYSSILEKSKANGFDVNKVVMTKQDCSE